MKEKKELELIDLEDEALSAMHDRVRKCVLTEGEANEDVAGIMKSLRIEIEMRRQLLTFFCRVQSLLSFLPVKSVRTLTLDTSIRKLTSFLLSKKLRPRESLVYPLTLARKEEFPRKEIFHHLTLRLKILYPYFLRRLRILSKLMNGPG